MKNLQTWVTALPSFSTIVLQEFDCHRHVCFYQLVKLENCLLDHILQLISGCDTWSFFEKEVSLDTHLTIHSVVFIWSLYASVAEKSYFCSRPLHVYCKPAL